MSYKMLRRACRDERGFSLAELMVVVVIIGILTAIAVPVYRNVTANANKNAVEANLRIIDGAIMMYQAEKGGADPEQSDLENGYLQFWPVGPDGVTYGITTAGTIKATATKGETGDWWTAGDTVFLPVDWESGGSGGNETQD